MCSSPVDIKLENIFVGSIVMSNIVDSMLHANTNDLQLVKEKRFTLRNGNANGLNGKLVVACNLP
jgi:hypothetical protein